MHANNSHRAAVYQARGGKYLSEFSILNHSPNWPKEPDPPPLKGKAGDFDTLDDAIAWFRPGPLTNELMRQLVRWQPGFIE